MKAKYSSFCFIIISLFLCTNLLSAAENKIKTPSITPTPPAKGVQVLITGKVSIEQGKNKERINLTDLQGKSYRLFGELLKDLKTKAIELGDNNLFSLKITPDGKNSLSCEKVQTYTFNNKNEKTLQIEAKCIRSYFAEVNEIVSAGRSDKPTPEPARDTAEEHNIIVASASQKSGIIPFTTGEIYGKIGAVDLNSPFKTVLVVNRNTSDALKNISLVITQNTRIAKKIGMAEPINLLPNALAAGQEVTAVYARDELKSEALYITITKE
ncbi:MAG: hypothetical protein WBE75_05165 [Candidatus Omnitrophota bacterium]|jgi:hypothetical protein